MGVAMGDKKGISGVILTVIMVALTLVAVAVVWAVIQNLITGETEKISLGFVNIDLKIENVDVNDTEENILVNVKRNTGKGDLIGMKFIFSNGTSSESNETEIVLKELEQESFTFTLDKINSSEAKTVSIAPIYGSESNKIIGSITDTFVIEEFLGGGGGSGGSSGGGSSGTSGDTGGDTGDAICNGVFETGEECDGGVNCVVQGEPEECTCPTGYISDSLGGCEIETTINTGTVGSTWPPSVVKYFDSEDFPKDISVSTYIGKYVEFTGAETRCLRLTYAEYLGDPLYDKSYVRVELVAEITAGDTYSIWSSSDCGAS